MKTFLLYVLLLLAPTLLGLGSVSIYNKIRNRIKKTANEKSPFMERFFRAYSTGTVIMLLIAAASNLATFMLKKDLSGGVKIFGILMIIFASISYFIFMIDKFNSAAEKIAKSNGSIFELNWDIEKTMKNVDPKSIILSILAVVFSVLMLILCCTEARIYLKYDQTIETVNAFVSTGDFYSINPLTGLPYTTEYPTRLSLQALPFFYAVLSKAFDVAPLTLCTHIIPGVWMLAGMGAFYRIGTTLFQDKNKQKIFYMIMLFLLFCSDYAAGNLGFDIFHSAFRGGCVLLIVLSMLTFALALEQKYVACLLPIIAEPFIVMNQYMLGACLIITVGILIVSLVRGGVAKHGKA